MAERPSSVYISYVGADRALARELSKALTAQGIPVWFAENEIAPGEDWVEKIEKGLSEAKAVLLLISPEFLASPSANFEAGMALSPRSRDRRVIPILLRGVSPKEIPPPLKRFQSIVATGSDEGEILDKLAPVLPEFRVSKPV
jgi:hypothetical protein